VVTTINPVEGAWLAINLFAAGVIAGNLADAWHGWRNILAAAVEPAEVVLLTPEQRQRERARAVQARANLRREFVALYVAAVFTIIVLPALFREGDTPLTPLLALFISGAVGIALNSWLDRLTRRTLDRLLWERLPTVTGTPYDAARQNDPHDR
jgi:hypothetical protein